MMYEEIQIENIDLPEQKIIGKSVHKINLYNNYFHSLSEFESEEENKNEDLGYTSTQIYERYYDVFILKQNIIGTQIILTDDSFWKLKIMLVGGEEIRFYFVYDNKEKCNQINYIINHWLLDNQKFALK